MARNVRPHNRMVFRRLMLPWIVLLAVVTLLLAAVNFFQGRRLQNGLWYEQTRRSTQAMMDSYTLMKSQFENIARIIQLNQQNAALQQPESGVSPAARALAGFQYMQFLNSVKLGYQTVDSIWVVFGGHVYSSTRTRYQTSDERFTDPFDFTADTVWLYPRIVREISNSQSVTDTVCMTYVARLWGGDRTAGDQVLVNVSVSSFYNSLLAQSRLDDLLILDAEGRIVVCQYPELTGVALDADVPAAERLRRQFSGDDWRCVSVAEGGLTYFGAAAMDAHTDEIRLHLLYTLLVLVISLAVVLMICVMISRRMSSPLRELVAQFVKTAPEMDESTHQIVQQSLESIAIKDYDAPPPGNPADITLQYKKLMENIITPNMLERLDVMERYVILAAEIDEPLHQNGYAEKLLPYFEQLIRLFLKRLVREDERIYTVFVRNGLVATVISLSDDARFGQIEQLMTSLQEMLRAVSPCTVSMACSRLHSDKAEINQAMSEAIRAISWKLMRKPACHVFYQEDMDAPSGFSFHKARTLRILSSLDQQSMQGILAMYDEFIGSLKTSGASADDLMMVYYQLLGDIIHIQLQRSISFSRVFAEAGNSPYRYLSGFEFSDHIAAWLREKLILLWKNANSAVPAGNVYINNFQDYMNSQYMNDLIPEKVAAALGISYSYLRRLLSKEMNTTFSSYLLHLRLTHTKELLSTTQLTHKEIAEQVGFGSEQTLYRVFRQHEGVSPGEWRRTTVNR